MPRTNLPPTPAASAELYGKVGPPKSLAEKPFNLPPPAIAPRPGHSLSSAHRQAQDPSSPGLTLPPPPTRSRTIIQMKPKPPLNEESVKTPTRQNPKGLGKKAPAGSNITGASGKKQPSSTSVAGKKIARKTAHSVIERRRRSKMNEEFGTLKAMIPACTDQEMHKLAILQASIDYLRYLEKCVADLKAANNSLSTPLVQPQAPPRRPDISVSDRDDYEENDGEEDDEDIAMGETASNGVSPTNAIGAQDHINAYTSPQSITPSPAIEVPPSYQGSSYASSVSTLPSPAFGPQSRAHRDSQPQSHFSLSASTSPTIMPRLEQDHEATAALLMLNKDRRNPKGGRGMSVQDILSS